MPTTTSECARSSAPTPPDAAVDHTLDAQRAFGHILKAARERKGLTIGTIAEATKVCPSHFQALERGDVSRWPGGLFRRAFFRGYVAMVGLPIDETLDEFIRLFPDEVASGPAPAARPAPATETVRLALDDSWHGSKPPIALRIGIAVLDLIAMMLPASAVAWFSNADVATVVAVAWACYFTPAMVLLGTTPAAWALRRRSMLAKAWRRVLRASTPQRVSAPEPIEDFRIGHERAWVTDAHRVRPRHIPPRIRVRFKWS